MEEVKNTRQEEFKISGNWENQRDELQKKFSQLTQDDLKFEPGHENELLKRMETRLNKGRQEVINIIKKGNPAKV